jgi:hypothetical protein
MGKMRLCRITLKDTIPIKVDSLKPAIVTADFWLPMKGDAPEYNVEDPTTDRISLVWDLRPHGCIRGNWCSDI